MLSVFNSIKISHPNRLIFFKIHILIEHPVDGIARRLHPSSIMETLEHADYCLRFLSYYITRRIETEKIK